MKYALPFALATAFAASAHAELSEDRVNELIEQYLRENPQVIIESLQAYQSKEEAERAEKQQAVIKEKLSAFTGKNTHYGEAGNPKGDITIVEFFDYNCPACKMMFNSIDALLLEDKKVRVIFVELPIFGPTSDENAKISMAVQALEPTKYFRFHQGVMKQKGKINADQMLTIAEGLGIKKDRLKKEAAKEKYAELIEKDRALAGELQVTGTPALLVGTQFVGGALDVTQLKETVKKVREAK